MSAFTEADVRRIVREELHAERREQEREARERVVASAQYFVDAAARSAAENPARPGTLLEKVQGLRREGAEQALASALLAEASGDLFEGVPDSGDVFFEGSDAFGLRGVELPLLGVGGEFVSGGPEVADEGVDVTHEVSFPVVADTSTVEESSPGSFVPD